MKFKYLFLVLLISFLLIGCAPEVVEEVSEKQPEEEPVETTSEEVPEEEPVETPPVEEIPEEPEEEIPEEEPEEIIVIGSEGETHIVEVVTDGFSPETLTIQAGDTVEWKNVRTGRLNQALIVGAITCLDIRSEILESGESFSWTFNEPQNCTFVDGIAISYVFKVKVE